MGMIESKNSCSYSTKSFSKYLRLYTFYTHNNSLDNNKKKLLDMIYRKIIFMSGSSLLFQL